MRLLRGCKSLQRLQNIIGQGQHWTALHGEEAIDNRDRGCKTKLPFLHETPDEIIHIYLPYERTSQSPRYIFFFFAFILIDSLTGTALARGTSYLLLHLASPTFVQISGALNRGVGHDVEVTLPCYIDRQSEWGSGGVSCSFED